MLEGGRVIMDYQERVEAVAGMWRYYFQETVMTKEQQMEFRKCCKDAVVDVMDVLEKIGE